MARGITAAVFVIALILSMTMLGGIGFYASLGVTVDVESQNEDVVAAAEELGGVELGEGRSASITEGPLATVTPSVGVIQTFTTVIRNTSGVIQLLFGLPPAIADPIETFFRLAMVVTVLYLIRSGSPV